MTVLSEPDRPPAPVASRRLAVVRPASRLNRMTCCRAGSYSQGIRPLNIAIAARRGPGRVITFDVQPRRGWCAMRTASNAAVRVKLQKPANWSDSQEVCEPGLGHELADPDGFAIGEPIAPGTDFYLRPAPGISGITLTAKTVGDLHRRMLTGVALGEASQRFTPVALAIPTEMNIEFDISWQADEAWSYIVGDKR